MQRRRLLTGFVTGVSFLFSGCVSDINPYSNPYNQHAEYNDVKSLRVSNGLNGELNASITVVDADGTVLGEANVTVPEYNISEDGSDPYANESIPVADESGDYTAKVTVEGRGTVTDDFDLKTPVTNPVLYISEGNSNEPFSVSVDGAPDV